MKNAIKVLCFVLSVIIIAGVGSYFYFKDVWEYDFIDGNEKGTVVLLGYYGNSKNPVIPDRLRGKKVVSVGEKAFMESDITSVKLGKYVTTIETNAFRDCKKLENITLPEGMVGLGESSFMGCKALKSIKIPSTVKNMNDGVFFDSGVENVDFGKNPNFTIVNGVIYSKDMTTIYQALPSADLSDYTCPETVMVIKPGAFRSHKEIKSFAFNNGIKRIEVAVLAECENLTEITIPESVIYIGSIFASGSKLEKIYIPPQVTTIDKYAFGKMNDKLTIVTTKNSAADKFAKENDIKVEYVKTEQ